MKENNELYHYGVQGMKWGVRKSVYKSMNKSQKKAKHKKHYDTSETKIKKIATIGTILGGPLGGIIAGSMASKKIKNIPKSTTDAGEKYLKDKRKIYDNKLANKTKLKTINQKTYDKFLADDVEGIMKNMTEAQRNDVYKHVGRDADWPEVSDYIARKYNRKK